jgi:hypothetical protein
MRFQGVQKEQAAGWRREGGSSAFGVKMRRLVTQGTYFRFVEERV